MSQEVIEITEREIEVIEVVEKGPLGPIGPVGPQANINYTVVTANQTLSNSQNIAADTSGGSFTLTLPASPNAGDSIDIFDYANTFDTNPLTIARNGQPIESLAENLTANVEGAYFTLIYTGTDRGWQILPRYGVSGIEDVLSAEGDLLYRGASSETRLPIGTAGQVLKVNSGATAPEWGSISGSISVTGSDLTLSGTTGTAITNATLANSGVAAGTYTKVTVDTKGRVTSGTSATPSDVGLGNVSNTAQVTSVTGTAPIVSSGGTTPAISISAATTGAAGSMSSADKTKLDGIAAGAEVNVQSNWTEANSGSDAFILNKPTLGTAAAQDTSAFAAASHIHDAADVTTGTFDNARINFAAPSSIGSTTPAAGTFTTLTANNGTLAASAPVLDLAQTWNASGTTFTGLRLNVTDTASAAACNLAEFQTGGTTRVSITKAGALQCEAIGRVGSSYAVFGTAFNTAVTMAAAWRHVSGVALGIDGFLGSGSSALQMGANASIGWSSNTNPINANADIVILRDGADTLAQRRGLNPQTFRIYTTSGTATEYLFLRGRTGDNFQIGTIKGGTGSARGLEFQTDGTTRLTLGSAGGVTLNSGNLVLTDNTGSETATFDAQGKLTDNRTYDLPDASGTIALTSDLPLAGTKTYAVFTAEHNQPPATAFAQLDTRNSIAVLDFDPTTDESAVFVGILPEGAVTSSGLKVRLHWMATTATSDNCRWGVQFEKSGTDLDSDSFDTAAEAHSAANGTSGIETVTEITITTIDSLAAGDRFRLKVYRNADDATNDTMTGDAELIAVEVRSAA